VANNKNNSKKQTPVWVAWLKAAVALVLFLWFIIWADALLALIMVPFIFEAYV